MIFLRSHIISWISLLDPGYLALKRSLKTFIAILISLGIFWQTPGMAMFAAISSMLFSRSQAGPTIADRRFTMVVTGLIMVLLSVPVSLASQNDYSALALVLVASFLTFYLIGNRVVPDFPAVSILALSVVEMAFSHTLESGIKFSGLFLTTLVLVYVLHFVVWPTRPRKRLGSQIMIIMANMEDYYQAIRKEYHDAEAGMMATQEKSDKLRRSLGDFRRLWELFRVSSDDPESQEARYFTIYSSLNKIYEYLILMWQFRVNAWDARNYRKLIINNQKLDEVIKYLIGRHHPNLIKPSERRLKEVSRQVSEMGELYMAMLQKGYHEDIQAGWMAVMNTLKSLEVLIADLDRTDVTAQPDTTKFSVKEKFKVFFRQLGAAARKLKFSEPAFRLGLRSAIIIGATMTYSVFIEPDYGYWLVLFAVLLIRPNLGISVKVGKERLVGTVAGSLLAFGFIFVVPAGQIIFFVFVLISVFLMLWFINLDRMIPMVTSLTFMIVCLFYYLNPEDNSLFWLRILYTAAIVLLVIVLSFLLWPEKARKRFAATLADALELEKHFFEVITNGTLSGRKELLPVSEKQKIRDNIQRLNDVLEATKNEVLQEKVIIHGMNIRSYILRLLNTLQSLESVSGKCIFSDQFGEVKMEFTYFSQKVSEAFDAVIRALNRREDVVGFPELRSEFESLRKKIGEVKYSQREFSDHIPEYWNNSAFIWNFNPLILELEGIKNEIEMKMRGD